MTDNTAKNLIGRDLINLRDALKRTRSFIAELANEDKFASALLARIDTLIYRHVDPELDVAKMWASGDYRSYPVIEGAGSDIPIGAEVISSWSVTHGKSALRGTVIGHGNIREADGDYPCYIVLLPDRFMTGEGVNPFRSAVVVVMRADRTEVAS